ncbi:MAG: hypothetical protein CL843_09330 [Crocinitomicaceae bacterium]|nr:hypothetical protein [Crocinitomicaceae bacterium]|tara:strand:- start:567 stop:776 length:210 start_codon:yes stop_codon:yes gene_type:complete
MIMSLETKIRTIDKAVFVLVTVLIFFAAYIHNYAITTIRNPLEWPLPLFVLTIVLVAVVAYAAYILIVK